MWHLGLWLAAFVIVLVGVSSILLLLVVIGNGGGLLLTLPLFAFRQSGILRFVPIFLFRLFLFFIVDCWFR